MNPPTDPGAGAGALGLDDACAALAQGRAVVIPNPSPMTYGIIATSAERVNTLKHRPTDQNVAVSVHHAGEWQQVARSLDLPPDVLARVAVLLRQRLSLLVPLRTTASYPGWLDPAVRNGYLAMFDGRWAPTARLWDRFPRLYGSSANRTGRPPAASAPEAFGIVGTDALIVDGDALRDLGRTHAASSIVQVAPDGGLSLYRRGAHDTASGLDPQAFAHQLATMNID